MTAHGMCARFEIFESARHFRIEFESGRPIRILIESRSFAGPLPLPKVTTRPGFSTTVLYFRDEPGFNSAVGLSWI